MIFLRSGVALISPIHDSVIMVCDAINRYTSKTPQQARHNEQQAFSKPKNWQKNNFAIAKLKETLHRAVPHGAWSLLI